MKNILMMCLLALPLTSFAGSYQGGLTIDRLWVEDGYTRFGFTTPPNDCIGIDGYFSIFASISSSDSAYKELHSLLLTAKSTGKKVDIWYESRDKDSCNTLDTILDVYKIGISVGQN